MLTAHPYILTRFYSVTTNFDILNLTVKKNGSEVHKKIQQLKGISNPMLMAA
jgi:hypothetical protein